MKKTHTKRKHTKKLERARLKVIAHYRTWTDNQRGTDFKSAVFTYFTKRALFLFVNVVLFFFLVFCVFWFAETHKKQERKNKEGTEAQEKQEKQARSLVL